MALRQDERPERRLSPEEARAFLQVHAEREAADAPRLDDLAETLGLSPNEATSILREARSRAAATDAIRPKGSSHSSIVWACIATLSLIWVGLATLYTRASVAPALVATPTAVSAPLLAHPSPQTAPLAKPRLAPVDYFGLDAWVGNATTNVPANPATFGERIPDLSAAGDQALRAELIERLIDRLEVLDDASLASAEQLRVGITTPDARTTTLQIPVRISTFPLHHDPQHRERVRAALAPVLETAWPQIVRAAPR